mmetsp:Transcript_5072/g.14074  ORF Transcript_5072/g.14074 Transcript_5072/m.14074 type:complete len:220 (+) Transcript_5072:1084-1743(+)
MANGSDSTQSRTRCSTSLFKNLRCILAPSGNLTSICTTSGPFAGSTPSAAAFLRATSKRAFSRSSSARCFSVSRRSLSAASWISASVCSLGITSTDNSVSMRETSVSGSNSRTTSSYVTPLCRIGSQSPSVSAVWPRSVSSSTCFKSMFTTCMPARWKPCPRGWSWASTLSNRGNLMNRISTCLMRASKSMPAPFVKHNATRGGTPTWPSSAVNSATPA